MIHPNEELNQFSFVILFQLSYCMSECGKGSLVK